MPRSNRNPPADPQAIAALRRGREIQGERSEQRDPGRWGISDQLPKLATSTGMTIATVKDGVRKRVVAAARRADAFTSLKGSLSAQQWSASQRYVTDQLRRAGVNPNDAWRPSAVDASGSRELVTQSMIDAGGRVERAHAKIGRMDARLLAALVGPMLRGEPPAPWRDVVASVAGVWEPHRQAERICGVCDNLDLAYDEIDREDLRDRRAPANDNDARALRANDG